MKKERYTEEDIDKKIKRDYAWTSFGGVVIGIILYKCLLFKKLDKYSYVESELCLWLIVLVWSGIGIIKELKKKDVFLIRDREFEDVVIGCGIYTVIAYCHTNWIRFVVLTIYLILLAYIILLFSRKIKKKQFKRKIIAYRLKKAAHVSYGVTVVGMSIIVFGLYFGGLFRQLIFSITVNNRIEEAGGKTIEDNIETLIKLKEWGSISFDEKVNVLSIVAEIECNSLGISDKLNIIVDKNMLEYQEGYYNDAKRTIVINYSNLQEDSGWNSLNTILHEIYHCYQHRIVQLFEGLGQEEQRLFLLRHAKVYQEEFKKYVNPEIDDMGYMNQQCEVDARRYAEIAVEKYYSSVMNYLTAKGQ